MAFNVDDQIIVTDQSSHYRNRRGFVKSVSGELHQVQLDQHGCNNRVALRTSQMRADSVATVADYSYCTG